jgi:hypothetical protein
VREVKEVTRDQSARRPRLRVGRDDVRVVRELEEVSVLELEGVSVLELEGVSVLELERVLSFFFCTCFFNTALGLLWVGEKVSGR